MSEPRKPVTYFSAGRRLAMHQSEWLPSFYVSYSPRNDNSNAEGPWEEWVDLARQIIAEDESRKASSSQEIQAGPDYGTGFPRIKGAYNAK